MIQHMAFIGECMLEKHQDTGVRFGGDALNAAYYAGVTGRPLGVTSHFVTMSGNDHHGEMMRDAWGNLGLNDFGTALIATGRTPSAAYSPAVDAQKKRQYVYENRGAAFGQLTRHVEWPAIAVMMLEFNLIHTTLISLMLLDDAGRTKLVDLFRDARAQGVKTAFDTNYRPNWAGGAEEAAHWANAIFAHTDIALPTNDDLVEIYGERDEYAAMALIRARGVKEIVCKCGEDATLISDQGQMSAHSVSLVAANDIVDTTAAGDSFVGTYLALRMAGKTPIQAAGHANRVAGSVIQHKGAIIPEASLPVYGRPSL